MNAIVRRTGFAAVLALLIIGAVAKFNSWSPWTRDIDTTTTTPERPTVIETNGGQLIVAIVNAKERFRKTDDKKILGIPLGTTISRLQVGVNYNYYIEMAKRWPVECGKETCVVNAPEIKPKLPVAFDTGTMEVETSSGWARFNKHENLQTLITSLTAELEKRSKSPDYESMVRHAARTSVNTYVTTWIRGQKLRPSVSDQKVIVLFPGETVESVKRDEL